MATTTKKTTTAKKAVNQPLAKNGDLTALYNQAYPNASKANASTLAQTKQNVDDMSVRDRYWDSLNFSYGQQREESDKAFDKAYSQAANAQLGRGMQRSSYGAQTLANLGQQKVEAQNKIYGQQIADYEKALLTVEQQEREQENWERQFAESKRQFDVLHPQSTGGGGGGGGYSGSSGRSGGRGGNPKPTDPNNLQTGDQGLLNFLNTQLGANNTSKSTNQNKNNHASIVVNNNTKTGNTPAVSSAAQSMLDRIRNGR